jgi:hypothetical protein
MELATRRSDIATGGFVRGSRCPYCRDWLVAPESSELVDGQDIRHRWVCDGCGRESETAIALSPRRRIAR